MARWNPDARGRLEHAALELFVEHGYDNTTVADIAARAGLTERTFFRYFADKREVLFGGADAVRELLATSVAAAPTSSTPMEIISAALGAVCEVIQGRREVVPLRQSVINAHRELQERELIKLAAWTDVLTDSLRKRGLKDRAARLSAEAGMAAFKVAFERWSTDPGRKNLPRILRATLEELKVVTSGSRLR